MVDVFLMDALLAAVPMDARLVILGDADQLASVGAGATFRDLARAGESRGFATRIHTSFRMDPSDPDGRALYLVARRPRRLVARMDRKRAHVLVRSAVAGDDGPLFRWAGVEPESKSDVPSVRVVDKPRALALRGVEAIEATGASRAALFDAWFDRLLTLPAPLRRALLRPVTLDHDGALDEASATLTRALLRHHERSRVLCVTRDDGRRTSEGAVNAYLHDRHARTLGGIEAAIDEGAPAPGTPLAVNKNDYERQLWNGDQGVAVLGEDSEGEPTTLAVFARGDGLVAFPLAALGDSVRVGFASTVHKAQGSEYAHVAFVLPDDDLPLLTRELLYTALTRASRSALLVGARALVDLAIQRGQERDSGLAERLLDRATFALAPGE